MCSLANSCLSISVFQSTVGILIGATVAQKATDGVFRQLVSLWMLSFISLSK